MAAKTVTLPSASVKVAVASVPHIWSGAAATIRAPRSPAHVRQARFQRRRAKLDQIQLSLGNASIQTTERYLGVQQELTDAPCDYLHLKVTGSKKNRCSSR